MMASTRLRPQDGQSARAAGRKAVTARALAAVAAVARPPAKRAGKATRRAEPAAAPSLVIDAGGAADANAVSGWGVYILRCADTTLYTGCTNDRDRRLGMHGKGRVKYTRGRLPVAIVYWEECADKSAALRAEAALKRLPRRVKLALCGYAKLC